MSDKNVNTGIEVSTKKAKNEKIKRRLLHY